MMKEGGGLIIKKEKGETWDINSPEFAKVYLASGSRKSQEGVEEQLIEVINLSGRTRENGNVISW